MLVQAAHEGPEALQEALLVVEQQQQARQHAQERGCLSPASHMRETLQCGREAGVNSATAEGATVLHALSQVSRAPVLSAER